MNGLGPPRGLRVVHRVGGGELIQRSSQTWPGPAHAVLPGGAGTSLRWLSGFDACHLTAGAAQYFERIVQTPFSADRTLDRPYAPSLAFQPIKSVAPMPSRSGTTAFFIKAGWWITQPYCREPPERFAITITDRLHQLATASEAAHAAVVRPIA